MPVFEALGQQEIKKLILISALFLLMPLGVYAVVFGGSNIGIMGYPSHDCIKPNKPFKPYSFNSQWEIEQIKEKL